MKRDGFAMAGVLLIVLALAVIGGIGYAHYVYLPKMAAQNNATSTIAIVATTTTTTQHITAVVTSSVAKISIGADVQTTVSCGTQDCFNKDFASCTPATLTSEAGGVGAVSYKIIGPVSGGCKMTFVYTANPNPAWVNQPMTCTYDNTLDFQTSIQNTFEAAVAGKSNCTGPLVAILKSAG